MRLVRGGYTGALGVLVAVACSGSVVTGNRLPSGDRDAGLGDGGASGTGGSGSGGRIGTGGRVAKAGTANAGGAGGTRDVDASTVGSGGVIGNGGRFGSGGATSSGGRLGTGGLSASVYPCLTRPPYDAPGAIAGGGPCCNTAAGMVGRCADAANVPPALAASYGHAGCATGLECVADPPAIAAATSLGVYLTCTANLGANLGLEGRCLPKCLVAGSPLGPFLTQESCPTTDSICMPCYDPIDAASTGACSQKIGDSPTTPAPTPFKACGAFDGGPSDGICLPSPLVDAGNIQSKYQQDDCYSGSRCVPRVKAIDPRGCYAACTTTLGAIFGDPKYAPGACVPAFHVRDVNAAGLTLLARDTCAGVDELCTPCLDPLNSGAPTHDCE